MNRYVGWYHEIMSNPEKMKLIRKSEDDIREWRVKEVTSVEDLLSESHPWNGSSRERTHFLFLSPAFGIIRFYWKNSKINWSVLRMILIAWGDGFMDPSRDKSQQELPVNIVWYFLWTRVHIPYSSSCSITGKMCILENQENSPSSLNRYAGDSGRKTCEKDGRQRVTREIS
jgi:hypothetical protein